MRKSVLELISKEFPMEHKESTLHIDRTDRSAAPRSRRLLFLFALGAAVLFLVAGTISLSLQAAESNPASELIGEIGADSARWEAMGDYYAARAADIERGAAASVTRWEAMGDHYAAEAADIERSAAASVARWEAMGEHYAAKAADVERGAAASVARWEAMGEYYAAKAAADVERGTAASVARWEAMGEYYSR